MKTPVTPKARRGYSLDIRDHAPLVRKMARTFYARLQGAQITGVDYDDVEGECNLAFHVATRGFDPDRGFTFTALLQISLQNHFNKFAARLMKEQFGRESGTDCDALDGRKEGLGLVLMGDMRPSSMNDDEAGCYSDSVACELFPSPEDVADFKSRFAEVMRDATLLPETRVYIGMLSNPSMPVSPAVRRRLKESSAKVKEQVRDRWGVEMRNLSFG